MIELGFDLTEPQMQRCLSIKRQWSEKTRKDRSCCLVSPAVLQEMPNIRSGWECFGSGKFRRLIKGSLKDD